MLISDHQAILLKLLDSKIHAYKGSFPEFIGHEELSFLIQQFQVVAKEVIHVVLSVKNSSDNKSDLEVDQVTNTYTAIILLLQMINELFVADEKHEKDIKSMLVGVDALQLVTGTWVGFHEK